MRYIIIGIYQFYRFFFLNNSSRNPNYRTLISYESRAWDFIHFSNVPPRRHRRAYVSTSTAAVGYFPNTFSRIGHATHRRRRNPRRRHHWKRGDGSRVGILECQGRRVSDFHVAAEFSRREDVGQRARGGCCSYASKKKI